MAVGERYNTFSLHSKASKADAFLLSPVMVATCVTPSETKTTPKPKKGTGAGEKMTDLPLSRNTLGRIWKEVSIL